MSTNALITIEGIGYAGLYKHWDGYPEATLPWLKEFNESFPKRGLEYKFAQLVRSSASQAQRFKLDDSTTDGWGIVANPKNDLYQKNMDIDYIYDLKLDGTVTVKKT